MFKNPKWQDQDGGWRTRAGLGLPSGPKSCEKALIRPLSKRMNGLRFQLWIDFIVWFRHVARFRAWFKWTVSCRIITLPLNKLLCHRISIFIFFRYGSSPFHTEKNKTMEIRWHTNLLSGRVIIPHYTVHVSRFSHARAVYLENGERHSKGEKKILA